MIRQIIGGLFITLINGIIELLQQQQVRLHQLRLHQPQLRLHRLVRLHQLVLQRQRQLQRQLHCRVLDNLLFMDYYGSKVKIVYNPKDGAPITSFIHDGVMVDSHYPDGFELKDGKLSKGLVQYEDATAKEILETYQFLREVTVDESKKILEKPADPQYECDFPDCQFKTYTKIALAGHKRTHAQDVARFKEPLVDPAEIPVSNDQKVPRYEDRAIQVDIPNGKDGDGVEFYGGVKVEKFGAIRKPGKGHFVG